MKYSLTFGILSIATALISVHVPPAKAVPNNPQSFEQWCLQKDSLPVETKKTVELLLKKLDTKDCQLADSKINSLSELTLDSFSFGDIKPFAEMEEFDVHYNAISDIKPLASLPKLIKLNISGNQSTDIKPLAGLTNLTKLDIAQIKDESSF